MLSLLFHHLTDISSFFPLRCSEVLSPACEATRPRASTSPAGSRSQRDPNPRPCPPSASGARPRRQGTLLPCPTTLPTTATTPAITVCNGVQRPLYAVTYLNGHYGRNLNLSVKYRV
ncbi:calcium-binding EF-hand family protein [Actinidia rufa]|uniref:Calcium-binding EF-hand family protein n=1 Tax=Actinidia rufa TaxID=165716 RepID=A0A7J0HAM1_9ERIC|nr:calcium-binding EF-hand family protein [Actinidia rufa]